MCSLVQSRELILLRLLRREGTEFVDLEFYRLASQRTLKFGVTSQRLLLMYSPSIQLLRTSRWVLFRTIVVCTCSFQESLTYKIQPSKLHHKKPVRWSSTFAPHPHWIPQLAPREHTEVRVQRDSEAICR